MDWLRGRFRPSTPIVVDLTDLGRIVRVVGESRHQPELLAVNGGYTRPDDDRDASMPAEPDNVVAELVAEPLNEFDAHAVAVRMNGRPVGYLSRDVAPGYQPIVLEIAGRGQHAICLARIVGGYVLEDGSRAYFGAELFLCRPEEVPGRHPEPARVPGR